MPTPTFCTAAAATTTISSGLGDDYLLGEGGTADVITYAYSTQAIGTDMRAVSGGYYNVAVGPSESDFVSGFEIFYGTDFGDVTTGTDSTYSATTIYGGDGADVIRLNLSNGVAYDKEATTTCALANTTTASRVRPCTAATATTRCAWRPSATPMTAARAPTPSGTSGGTRASSTSRWRMRALPTVTWNGGQVDTLYNINNVYGTNASGNIIRGNSSANALVGGNGTDTFRG